VPISDRWTNYGHRPCYVVHILPVQAASTYFSEAKWAK